MYYTVRLPPMATAPIMSLIKYPRKRNFDSYALFCDFCQKKGHTIRGCLALPTVPDEDERQDYFDCLINSPRLEQSRFDGLTLKQAACLFLKSGTKLNTNNPVKSATDKRNVLRSNIGFWKALGAGKSVISWHAYGLPCRHEIPPQRIRFKNHKSYYDNINFCDKEVKKHVNDGSFSIVDKTFPEMILPQQVEFNSAKKARRVDDERWLNSYLAYMIFTMESLGNSIPQVVRPKDKLISADLEKAYYKVWMQRSWRKYMCFEHKGDFISSNVLLFGMGPAPFWFTKISRPMLGFFRTLLINVTNYVDDWLFSERIEKVHELVEFVMTIFSSLGWVVNDKSVLKPSDHLIYLGLIVDAENFMFKAPQHKIDRVKAVITRLTLKSRAGEPIELADLRSVSGYCVSLSLALPPIMLWVRLMNELAPLNFGKHDTHTSLDPESIRLLEQLPILLDTRNGHPIVQQPIQPDFSFHLDAGEMGCGVHEAGNIILTEALHAFEHHW